MLLSKILNIYDCIQSHFQADAQTLDLREIPPLIQGHAVGGLKVPIIFGNGPLILIGHSMLPVMQWILTILVKIFSEYNKNIKTTTTTGLSQKRNFGRVIFGMFSVNT